MRWQLTCWFTGPANALECAAPLQRLQRLFGPRGVAFRIMMSPAHVHDPRLVDLGNEVTAEDSTIEEPFVQIATVGGRVLWNARDLDDSMDALSIVTAEPHPQDRIMFVTDLLRHVSYHIGDGPAVPELSAQLVVHMPNCGRARAYRCIDDIWNRADRTLARSDAAAAIAALAADAWSLTVCCDLVLRSDPHEHATAQRIATAMQAIVAASPHATNAWLVWLRAAQRCAPETVTGIDFAARLLELADRPDQRLELVEILADAADPAPFAAAMVATLAELEQAGVDRRTLLATRAKVAQRAAVDPDEVAACLRELAAPGSAPARNKVAWELLTQLPTMGRFDSVALALAEGLRRADGSLRPDHQDTLAVALYGVGRIAEAITCETAVIEADPDDPRYEIRRRRFASAEPGQPRTR